MNKTIKNLKAKLIELEESEHTPVQYELGYRGGNYTIPATDALALIGIYNEKAEQVIDSLPSKIGAGCNYLGGGLRGAVFGSADSPAEFEKHGVPHHIALNLYALVQAIIDRYVELKNGLNEETDESGETNWDAIGTNASRRAGVRSAY